MPNYRLKQIIILYRRGEGSLISYGIAHLGGDYGKSDTRPTVNISDLALAGLNESQHLTSNAIVFGVYG